jgi:hypothetical protein
MRRANSRLAPKSMENFLFAGVDDAWSVMASRKEEAN